MSARDRSGGGKQIRLLRGAGDPAPEGRHPLWAKILHWLHLAAMLVLIPSGFWISYANRAFLFSSMRMARQWHFYAMWILTWVLIARIYFIFATGTWREFMVTGKDLRDLPKLGRFYLFLSDEQPKFSKYNPGQKLLYSLWPWVLALQALTGFILYAPTHYEALWEHSWLLSLNTIRTVHFLLAWFFVLSTAGHLYLVIIEGMDELKEMGTLRR